MVFGRHVTKQRSDWPELFGKVRTKEPAQRYQTTFSAAILLTEVVGWERDYLTLIIVMCALTNRYHNIQYSTVAINKTTHIISGSTIPTESHKIHTTSCLEMANMHRQRVNICSHFPSPFEAAAQSGDW